jgi:hypothetical protein
MTFNSFGEIRFGMIFLLWRDFFKLCHKKSFLAQNLICAPFIGAITQKQGV